MKHRRPMPLITVALITLLLPLAGTAHAERRYFTAYDYPAKTPDKALYYVELPLPENPDGPGYLYRAHYRENDALYAEGIRAGTGKDADWFGDWRYLYPDGQVKEKGHSDDQGHLDGEVISYFENGQVDEFKPYTAGKLEGVEKHYDEEGHLLIQIPYRNGRRDGMQIAYYGEDSNETGGRIYEETRYKDGDYDHFYNRYNRDGRMIGHADYTAPGVFMAWTKDNEGDYRRREATFQRDDQGRFRDDAPVWLRVIGDHDDNGAPKRAALRYPQDSNQWVTGFNGDTVVRLEHEVNGIAQGPTIVSQYGGGREEGQMIDGQRTGTWHRYDDQNRLVAVKSFDNNELHGEIRERSGPDLQRWTYKHYRRGKQHGPWRTENAAGEVVESGRYRDDARVGAWRTLRDEGDVEQATYVDGELDGDWALHSPSGALLAERHYRHGDAIGTWKRFNENGDLTYRATFENNERQGEVFQQNSGGTHTYAHFQTGRREGPYRETSREGYPLLEGHYADGKRQGRFVEYSDQGRVERITPYQAGRPQGEGWIRDHDGELVPARWNEGRLVEPQNETR